MIESAEFTETGMIKAVIDGDTVFIPPNDMRNRDRRLIVDWEAKGNTIAPYVAPVIDLDELDQTTINQALAAEGSIVRALGLVMFEEINKLRQRASLPQYTLAQFQTALITKIRDRA